MHPVIWQFELLGGTRTIYAFGTFIVLAFLLSSWFVRWRGARTLELDRERVFNICFVLLFLGLLGARLLYVFVHYPEFAGQPLRFLKIWEGGLVFYGGLLAGLAWLAWYLPRHPDLKGFAFLDVTALGACLAIFVGRWASFLAGENYGRVAEDLPWGMKFPFDANSQAPPGIKVTSKAFGFGRRMPIAAKF